MKLALLLRIESPTTDMLLVARWLGAALLSIGVMLGMARDDGGNAAVRGVLTGLVSLRGEVAA